jgi:methionine biosynthesis protein MetW
MTLELNKLMQADRDIITSIIPEKSNVLDLGCGDGGLLAELKKKKGVTGRGVDIDEENLITGIDRGLSVYMGDLDDGLSDYPDKMYDYVILNQTLQVIKKPAKVMREMLRVGKYGIVGFPNFGNWYLRLYLLFTGRLPKSKALPFEWHNTPNIHQLTVLDFKSFCKSENIQIINEYYLIFGKWGNYGFLKPFANLFAITGMFVLEGKNTNKEK